MTVLLGAVAIFLVLSASMAGILLFRGRTRGIRLIALAPLPLAVVVGVFAGAYFAVYATDYVAAVVFVVLCMLAVWLAGFICCALLVGFTKLT